MSYEQAAKSILAINGVEESTMMKAPCLRFRGKFVAMMFDQTKELIVKVAPERVNELIAQGKGYEFNFTGKRFREWILIPLSFQDDYESLMREALRYARLREKDTGTKQSSSIEH